MICKDNTRAANIDAEPEEDKSARDGIVRTSNRRARDINVQVLH